MVHNFTPMGEQHANQLEAEAPYIWLYELQTKDDPPKRYRMTNFTESVEFGMDTSGSPFVYSPTPIVHGDVEEQADGSLPTITVTVGHAGPIVSSTLDSADGFVGQPVRIILVSMFDLSRAGMVFAFWSMMVFLGVLTVGFIYEWKKGALEWE